MQMRDVVFRPPLATLAEYLSISDRLAAGRGSNTGDRALWHSLALTRFS